MHGYAYIVEKEDFRKFGPNEVAEFQYISLVNLGVPFDDIHPFEFSLIQVQIAEHMPKGILFVFKKELDELDENVFLKSICTVFEEQEKVPKEYISITTLNPKVNERLYLKPVTRPIFPERFKKERYRYQASVSACMAELSKDLELPSMVLDFHFNTKSSSLVIPRGQEILKLRSPRSQSQILKSGSNPDPIHMDLDVKTLRKAERCNPIEFKSLKIIADFFDVPSVDFLRYEQVICIPLVMEGLRRKTRFSKDQLLSKFKIDDPLYFDKLESYDPIPADYIRYAWTLYKDTFKQKVDIIQMIDVNRSDAIRDY
jgi:hypothetical protein